MTQAEWVAEIQRAFRQDGRSEEEMLARLRKEGCTMADSVLLLAEATGMEAAEAVRKVVLSQTWEDFRGAYFSLEDAFWGAADEVGEFRSDGKIHIDFSDL
jgi:hypothetical protein